MAKLQVDPETGEIIQQTVMVGASKAPAISLDINEVTVHHKAPEKLVDMIRSQAGFAVFDVSHEKGRAECRSHAANIIRCIAPALNASKALAEEAKQVVKQDLEFRRVFEQGVREIAAFHRQPLTEWEAEQERIKELNRLAEEARSAAEQYQKDWKEAIDYDELFTLRREKEESARKAFESKIAEEEKALFEREVEARLEAERQRIQAEEEAKAAAKLKAEQDRIERERLAEEVREAEAKFRAEQEEERRKIIASGLNHADKVIASITLPEKQLANVGDTVTIIGGLSIGGADLMMPILEQSESHIEKKIKALEVRIEAGDMSIHDALMTAYRIGYEQ
jgi:hypothetical protein